MKKIMIIIACAAVEGCAVTSAEWGGEEVVNGADGNPVIAADGSVQKIKQPTKLYANRHWFDSHIDSCELHTKAGEIDFKLNGYTGVSSTNAAAYVDTCLKGVATITEKVCAAILTSGGSVAGSAASAAITAVANKFISAGGNAETATVTCENGNCTITDGTVTEVCEGCCDVK